MLSWRLASTGDCGLCGRGSGAASTPAAHRAWGAARGEVFEDEQCEDATADRKHHVEIRIGARRGVAQSAVDRSDVRDAERGREAGAVQAKGGGVGQRQLDDPGREAN